MCGGYSDYRWLGGLSFGIHCDFWHFVVSTLVSTLDATLEFDFSNWVECFLE